MSQVGVPRVTAGLGKCSILVPAALHSRHCKPRGEEDAAMDMIAPIISPSIMLSVVPTNQRPLFPQYRWKG